MNETRTAEAATIAWMLTLMATLSAEALGLITRVLAVSWESERARVLSGTLLLVAVLSGLILLILTAITLKVRDAKPPRPLVVLAVVGGLLPVVTATLLVLR